MSPVEKRSLPNPDDVPLVLPDGVVEEILTRLRRVEGQVRAVQRMIVEGRDCHAIGQQMSAAQAALERAMVALMVQSMAHCVRKGSRGERDLERLTKTFVKLLS